MSLCYEPTARPEPAISRGEMVFRAVVTAGLVFATTRILWRLVLTFF